MATMVPMDEQILFKKWRHQPSCEEMPPTKLRRWFYFSMPVPTKVPITTNEGYKPAKQGNNDDDCQNVKQVVSLFKRLGSQTYFHRKPDMKVADKGKTVYRNNIPTIITVSHHLHKQLPHLPTLLSLVRISWPALRLCSALRLIKLRWAMMWWKPTRGQCP